MIQNENLGYNLPDQKLGMPNKIQHQIDQSNCYQPQRPCYPATLICKSTQSKFTIWINKSTKFEKKSYLQCLQKFRSSTLSNSSKTLNKFLSSHANTCITAWNTGCQIRLTKKY